MSAKQEYKEFLLEVGAEEIPASMVETGLADLKRLLIDGFTRHRLNQSLSEPGSETASIEIQTFSTPRRLVAYVPRLITRQPDSSELVTGPPKKVAFDAEGKPSTAALSFATKMGTTVEKLKTVTTPKGDYLAFTKKERGKPTIEILKDLIPQAILGVGFPRAMYWEAKTGPKFIRPIRSLLALFGGRVVPCSIGAVKASNWTFGHRRLGKSTIKVKDFAEYREALSHNHVVLDANDRRERIWKGIETALAVESGLKIKENSGLLETLVYLTEYPTPLVGSFDPSFLSLPEEVLTTVMRGHQKYFAVKTEDGKLAPRFVAIMNLNGDATGAIRHGNEKVLRARFNDARFFWEADAKHTLLDRLEQLKSVTFQSQLGTYYEKATRMSELVAAITNGLGNEHKPTIPVSELQQAASLAKCDLPTELVKEFTELQGIIGGLYARRDGLPEEVATAIYDHYKPESMDDESPRTLAGALVSLADRMDTLAGCFGVGLAPSGSKDPFALRRAAQGVIRILVDYRLPVVLSTIAEQATAAYHSAQTRGEAQKWKPENVAGEVAKFLNDRLRYYFTDIRGYAYDEVNAVLATVRDRSIPELADTINALSKIRPTENFEPLAAAFKRIKNIQEQARKSHGYSGGELNPSLLHEEAESRLHDRYLEVKAEVSRQKDEGNLVAALEAVSSLRPDVDHFFDKTMVMVEDAAVRQNRLSLLARLLSEFSTIADFSEIVVAQTPSA